MHNSVSIIYTSLTQMLIRRSRTKSCSDDEGISEILTDTSNNKFLKLYVSPFVNTGTRYDISPMSISALSPHNPVNILYKCCAFLTHKICVNAQSGHSHLMWQGWKIPLLNQDISPTLLWLFWNVVAILVVELLSQNNR